MSKINFDAPSHRYTDRKGNEYISATTLIGKYKQPFDSEYWATYKAIKDVYIQNHIWVDFKYEAGGWENVVRTFTEQIRPEYEDEVLKAKRGYLDRWDAQRELACRTGSEVHDQLEQNTLSNKRVVSYDEVTVLDVSMDDLLASQGFEGHGIFPELLLYNEAYRIAGMADVVEKHGRYVDILDYKTSKEITKEPFREQRMLPPVDLPDANYYHYTMQLSLYAWMLEQAGFTPRKLEIIHLHGPNYAESTHYPVPYERALVEAMVRDYATF